MLVNASQHPGPAMWQGIMLVAIAAWAIFLFREYPRELSAQYLKRRERNNTIATIILVVFGLVLFAAILILETLS